jgi:fermentation-respiration switch protein FrsA (DUF1100 family)
MKYLIFETLEAAKNRSASQAVLMGASKDCTTKYWWSWTKTLNGEWALLIPDLEALNLSELEQSSLFSRIDLATSGGM